MMASGPQEYTPEIKNCQFNLQALLICSMGPELGAFKISVAVKDMVLRVALLR